MSWKLTTHTPEEIAKELHRNLMDENADSARLLVMGTQTDKAYRMRMTVKNPEAIAGIIYFHATKTGELNEALLMCDTLVKIATTARKLIIDEVRKSKTNN